jgi:hypothetical protein
VLRGACVDRIEWRFFLVSVAVDRVVVPTVDDPLDVDLVSDGGLEDAVVVEDGAGCAAPICFKGGFVVVVLAVLVVLTLVALLYAEPLEAGILAESSLPTHI